MLRTVQTCDGCGDQRVLASTTQEETVGWIKAKPGKHLCPGCIEAALFTEHTK